MGYEAQKIFSGNHNGSESGIGPTTVQVSFSPAALEFAMIKQLVWFFDYVVSAGGTLEWFIEIDDGTNTKKIYTASDVASSSGSVALDLSTVLTIGAVRNLALNSTDTINIGAILNGTGAGNTEVTDSIVWASGSYKT